MNQSTLQEINNGIEDVINTSFTFDVNCLNVPHYDDSGLTFEGGQTKKGKIIETCVLFVDIRNSVALNQKYSKEIMGKIYTSFVKSALWCADYHNGSVRNIIGDRVMIVFPPKDCYTNAVNCAISINTIVLKIIKRFYSDFKCGIGIDYGTMYVHKTGIIKQGSDASSYKNLIWIGRPANIASRLTDVANKETETTIYSVKRNPLNPKAFRPKVHGIGLFPILGQFEPVPGQPIYLGTIETVDLSPEEFACSISQLASGEIFTKDGNMLSFEKKEIKNSNKPILMTKSVYDGYARTNPTVDSVKKKYWNEIDLKIKDYTGKIYGGNVYWSIINNITF